MEDCNKCKDADTLETLRNILYKQKMAYRAALIEACSGDKVKISELVQKHMERLGV